MYGVETEERGFMTGKGEYTDLWVVLLGRGIGRGGVVFGLYDQG
jgi:hypothetical protein